MKENVLLQWIALEKNYGLDHWFLYASILETLIAQVADSTRLHELVPEINTESETLLHTISSVC
jgi:hypothetical protein